MNLHHEWDDIPTDIGEGATRELLSDAREMSASQGRIEDWPAAWASDTILVAHDAFAGLTFELIQTEPGHMWSVAYDDHVAYLRAQDAIKRKQLAKGGARLAEILNAIWPKVPVLIDADAEALVAYFGGFYCAEALTCLPIQSSRISAISRLLSSCISMCVLPLIPMSGSTQQLCLAAGRVGGGNKGAAVLQPRRPAREFVHIVAE